MCTAIPAKTDVNFYGRSATVDKISGTAEAALPIFARKNTGCWQMLAQHDGSGSGKGLARALDLIFSPSAPG